MPRESYYDRVLAIEMKNKILSLSSTDANLISVITMEFKFFFFFVMLVSLYDIISCDVINVKNSSIVCEVNATVFFFNKYYKCLKCKIKTPQLTFIKTNQPKIHK